MKLNFAKHLQKFVIKIRKILYIAFRSREKPFSYVALGDSTVEGVGASQPARSYTGIIHEHLKQARKNTIYNNFGKSNAKISDILKTQLDKAIALQPDLITISIGANDIRHRTPIKEFEHNLELLLKTLKKETTAEIIINNVPPLANAPIIPKHMRIATGLLLSRINNVIKKQAEKSNVIMVDIYNQSLLFVRNYPEVVSKDGLHPSDFGYAIWANTIITEINHLFVSHNKPLFR